MPTLTSLLARDAIVSLDIVEQALQRQVLDGGEIDTALLELSAVPENVLSAYRAASFDLPPASRAQLERIDAGLLERVPAQLAREFRVVPIAFESDVLVLAADAPLQAFESQRLGRMLGTRVGFRIATELRVQAALAEHYGLELPERLRKLVERLRAVSPGELCEVRRSTPSREPIAFKHRVSAAPTDTGLRAEREGGIVEAVRRASNTLRGAPMGKPVEPPATRPDRPSGRGPARRARQTSPKLPRGPFAWQQAVELLRAAEDRDRVLDVLFSFARQYFDCTALFMVRDDRLVAFRSSGLGGLHDGSVSVAWGSGGAVHGVSKTLAARIVDLRDSQADAALLEALGRARHQPCGLVPVAIRQRMIGLLYGDRAGEALSLSDFADVLPLLPSVAASFERLIQERKRGTTGDRERPSALVRGDAPPPPRLPVDLAPMDSDDIGFKPTIQLPSERAQRAVSLRPARSHSYRVRDVPADDVQVERREQAKTMPERPSRRLDSKRPGSGSRPRQPDGPHDHATVAPPPPRSQPPPGSGGYSMRSGAESGPGGLESLEPEALQEYHSPLPARDELPSRGAREFAAAPLASEQPGDRRLKSDRDTTDPELAPGSAARVSVPQPAASRTSLPSIVVSASAGEAERLAEELARSAPEQGQDLIDALVRIGPDALGALKRRFPGQLWFDRYKPRTRMPSSQQISAIASAVRAFEDKALPVIAELMGSGQVEARFCALLLAAERPRPELLWALYQRLFDSDGQVRVLALEVLPRYRPISEFSELLRLLRDRASDEREPIASRLSALEAIGTLRDVGSIELLFKLYRHPSRQLSVPAHRSLLSITAQDFGDSDRKWKAWFEKNRTRPRIEWLIESLMHNDERVRNTAGLELQKLTQVYYGFVASASKRDRERAQQRYRDWLRQQGAKALVEVS
jgi:hypothetical protein